MKNIEKKHRVLKTKRIGDLLWILVLFVFAVFVFKTEILSLYFHFKYKNHVMFYNLKTTFPNDIIYTTSTSGKSLVFFCWEKSCGFLTIGRMNLNEINRYKLVECFETKGLIVIDSNELVFKDLHSFSISYLDKKSWEYNTAIYVPSKNLRIIYTGAKENYDKYFKNIIDSIEFL